LPFQAKNSKQIKKGRGHGLASTSQLATSVTSEVTDLQSRTDAKVEVASNTAGNLSVSKGTDNTADNCIEIWNSRLPPRPLGRSASTGDPFNTSFHMISSYCIKEWSLMTYKSFLQMVTAEKSAVIGSSTVPDIPKFVDIDSDDKDPLLCCLYAPEIHYNLRVSEVIPRL